MIAFCINLPVLEGYAINSDDVYLKDGTHPMPGTKIVCQYCGYPVDVHTDLFYSKE